MSYVTLLLNHDVCVEHLLQPLSGEHLPYATANVDDNARLDVKARGFWGIPQQCAVPTLTSEFLTQMQFLTSGHLL